MRDGVTVRPRLLRGSPRSSRGLALRGEAVLKVHGFEGLSRVGHPGQFPLPGGPHFGERHIDRHTSCLRATALADYRDDLVARVGERLNLELPVVPDVRPIVKERLRPGGPTL